MQDGKSERYLYGSHQEDWSTASREGQRAFMEIHDRAVLLDLSIGAHRGPFELARRLQDTEHGADQEMSLRDWCEHLYGEDVSPDDAYPVSYCYEIQRIAPFLASVH